MRGCGGASPEFSRYTPRVCLIAARSWLLDRLHSHRGYQAPCPTYELHSSYRSARAPCRSPFRSTLPLLTKNSFQRASAAACAGWEDGPSPRIGTHPLGRYFSLGRLCYIPVARWPEAFGCHARELLPRARGSSSPLPLLHPLSSAVSVTQALPADKSPRVLPLFRERSCESMRIRVKCPSITVMMLKSARRLFTEYRHPPVRSRGEAIEFPL